MLSKRKTAHAIFEPTTFSSIEVKQQFTHRATQWETQSSWQNTYQSVEGVPLMGRKQDYGQTQADQSTNNTSVWEKRFALLLQTERDSGGF